MSSADRSGEGEGSVDARKVETAEFLRSSPFSRWLRRLLKALIIPRSDPANTDAYLEQFDEASRNVEIAAEGLGGLIKNHPLKFLLVLKAVGDWQRRYFGSQKDLADKPRYLVYTQLDNKIPFVPQEDILYTYMISQIAYVANELAGVVSARQMKYITECFIALNDIGVEAFYKHPTTMPRFRDHQRLSLKVIQHLDEPLNCCPSLHIAYSLLLDGIAEFVIKPLRNRRDAFKSIRFSTIGMFNSVLYTKQHSILDVAFGMLCARIVFEERFDMPFNDFVSVFPSLEDDHPIPYDDIVRIYEEALAIRTSVDNLAEILGIYLEKHGFVTVEPGEEPGICYFDLEKREIVGPSE